MLESQKQPLRGAARTDAQTTVAAAAAAVAAHQEERGGHSCVLESEGKAEIKVRKREEDPRGFTRSARLERVVFNRRGKAR